MTFNYSQEEQALIAKWLQAHELTSEIIFDCVECVKGGHLQPDLSFHLDCPEGLGEFSLGSPEHSIKAFIAPSLSSALHLEERSIAGLCDAITWNDLSEGDVPHSIDHGVGQSPEIRISWRGTVSDLVCLAHEVAHAVQFQLSAGSFMPPVARETCAFIGELALIDWANHSRPELAARLLSVWQEENLRYFGDDCEILRSALVDPDATYCYRMNYPLARAAAVVMWRSGADFRPLFKAGSEAMALLPLLRIADLGASTQNYLPHFPAPDTIQPAVDAYRALGAMTLLDIDFWKGESERHIHDYYATLLHHLQNGTVLLALDEIRRPVGYATWRKSQDDDSIALQRQAAPFGDHLLLQKAVERHLGEVSSVHSIHPNSARQEQMAW